MNRPTLLLTAGLTAGLTLWSVLLNAAATDIQLDDRPAELIKGLPAGPLRDQLQSCAAGPFQRSDFSIGHRGAPLQFPEHTRESYLAAARLGAGLLECDVTFTQDRQLVCRHSQCDLHTTTDILAIPDLAAKCRQPFTPADLATGTAASAECCTSDLTLAEFKRLKGKMDTHNPQATTVPDYLNSDARGTLLSHADSIVLFRELGVKFIPELKAPAVEMPFAGTYTQQAYAQHLIDEYKAAGIPPNQVWVQSFNLDDVRYWIKHEPLFAQQAVFLDERIYDRNGLNQEAYDAAVVQMFDLAAEGIRIVAPPLWVLLEQEADGQIVPSAYAKAAKAAGLGIITWTLERSGPLSSGGGWYYQSVKDSIDADSDMLRVLDVLARQVGIRGIFSDWPAAVTYYANCMGL